MNPSTQSLGQLESARALALGDGRYYPTIIPGVLPIIGPNANASIEIRRWGADFLAETFASPAWPLEAKEASCLSVLPTLKGYLTAEDNGIVKSAVQAAASIYPLVFKHTITDPFDAQNWQLMVAIKHDILRRIDSAPPGVRICCVKFLQQVVLAQTPGMAPDPRRPEITEISLAILPRDHRLIPYGNVEVEAQALLDRMLDIIHGDHSDALLVTATLNALGMLIQRRPMVANKILTSVLSLNPLKLANSPMTPRNKVIMKSMERTTRALLVNVMKRNPDNPFNAKIQQYLERMHRMRLDVFDESSRKRPAPVEPTDGLDQTKRQRLGADVPSTTPPVPALPPGPVSYKQLYTLDPNNPNANFDVTIFQDPAQLNMIVIALLQAVDNKKLADAIGIVRSRYSELGRNAARDAVGTANGTVAAGNDDEEDYEPDYQPEDAEQTSNRLDSAPKGEVSPERIPAAQLVPYKLPEAPPLSEQQVQKYGDMTVRRVFGMLSAIDDATAKAKSTKSGFNRLAATSYDRDSWITILSRLATRAAAGLDDPEAGIKSEYNEGISKGSFLLSDTVREALHDYIMYDWKKRLDVAISWLNEEWYNDHIQVQAARKYAKATLNGDASSFPDPKGNYKKCALRLLDGIIAYIEGSDKILVRFISEIPELDREILQRMKKMAEDPDRIDLSCMVLQYLHMFRPPVREICVDVLVDMWRTNDRAKPSAKKLLSKWRPSALESEDETKAETANGALEVKAVS